MTMLFTIQDAIFKIRKLNQRPLNNSKVNLQPTS